MRKTIKGTIAAVILTVAIGMSGMEAKAFDFTDPPEDIVKITKDVGAQYNIEPEILQALINRESRYNPNVSSGNCLGLTQVSSVWHRDRMNRLGVTNLWDPAQNITVCADLLTDMRDNILAENGQPADMVKVLMYYNMKHDSAERLYSQGIYSEYALSILERAKELKEKNLVSRVIMPVEDEVM